MHDVTRRTEAPEGWYFQRGIFCRFPVRRDWRRQTLLIGDNAIIYRACIPGLRKDTTWREFADSKAEIRSWCQWRAQDLSFDDEYATVLDAAHLNLGTMPGFLLDILTCRNDIYCWRREIAVFAVATDLWILGIQGHPNEIENHRRDFDQMAANSRLRPDPDQVLTEIQWGDTLSIDTGKQEAVRFKP